MTIWSVSKRMIQKLLSEETRRGIFLQRKEDVDATFLDAVSSSNFKTIGESPTAEFISAWSKRVEAQERENNNFDRLIEARLGFREGMYAQQEEVTPLAKQDAKKFLDGIREKTDWRFGSSPLEKPQEDFEKKLTQSTRKIQIEKEGNDGE